MKSEFRAEKRLQRIKEDALPLPACFDNEDQWVEWQDLALQSAWDRKNYCRDCLPEHKLRMLKEGRCSNPRIRFYYVDDDGDLSLVGALPKDRSNLLPYTKPAAIKTMLLVAENIQLGYGYLYLNRRRQSSPTSIPPKG